MADLNNVHILRLRGAPQSGKSTFARTLAEHVRRHSGEYVYAVPHQNEAHRTRKLYQLDCVHGGKIDAHQLCRIPDLLVIDDANVGPNPYTGAEIHDLAVKMSLAPGIRQILVIETEVVGSDSEYARGWRHGYNQRDAEVKAALV